MVSAGTQVSLLWKHGGHYPGQLFSLSLVYAVNGWSTLLLSIAGQLVHFHATVQWLNLMQLPQWEYLLVWNLP